MKRGDSWTLALGLLLAWPAIAEDFPGLSISPPAGNAWLEVQRTASTVVWMRRTGRDDVTLGVALIAQPLDRSFEGQAAFADWVRQMKEANPDPNRFRLLDSKLEPAPAPFSTCLIYATTIEDRGAGREPSSYLRLVVSGLACLHPQDSTRYFDIQYSARTAAGTRLPVELAREGQDFVHSLRFGPPPDDGDWSLGEGISRPEPRERT